MFLSALGLLSVSASAVTAFAADGVETISAGAIGQLSPDELLSLLDTWNLKKPFVTCFTEQAIDGDAIVNSGKGLVQAACPSVPLLQWDRLWRRLSPYLSPERTTGSGGGGDFVVDNEATASFENNRRLNDDDDELSGFSGVHMKTNMSAVRFGNDRAIYRSEEGLGVLSPHLNVDGDLLWSGMSSLDGNITDHNKRLKALEALAADLDSRVSTVETTVQECALLFRARACMDSITAYHDQSYFVSTYEGTVHGGEYECRLPEYR